MVFSKLRKDLDEKKISSMELTKDFLQKIEHQKNLNAFISVCPDLALEMATEADAKIAKKEITPLTGIPIAVKDMILVKGTRTTAASQFLKNFQSPYDAFVTKRLRQNHAPILGKTNCDEFAMGSSNENSSFGPVKNPWDTSRVPGGSSGGSASCVAAGIAPGALGTDTGGSVRQPAAFCGIVGLKPTYGRLSRSGVIAFASSLDQVGPMCKTVEDTAFLFEALAGHDPQDSTSLTAPLTPIAEQLKTLTSLKGKKIGFAPKFLPEGVDGEVKQNFFDSLKRFEKLGAELVEVELPHAEHGIACYYVIAPAEASANLERYDGIHYTSRAETAANLEELISNSRTQGFGSEVQRRILIGTFVLSSGYFDAYYLKAQKVRALIEKDFSDNFKKVDAILTPTTPTPAFKLGDKNQSPLDMYLADVFTVPVSIAGLPALSFLSGFTQTGLPLGLQLIGNRLQESTLLNLAHVFEQDARFFERTCP